MMKDPNEIDLVSASTELHPDWWPKWKFVSFPKTISEHELTKSMVAACQSGLSPEENNMESIFHIDTMEPCKFQTVKVREIKRQPHPIGKCQKLQEQCYGVNCEESDWQFELTLTDREKRRLIIGFTYVPASGSGEWRWHGPNGYAILNPDKTIEKKAWLRL